MWYSWCSLLPPMLIDTHLSGWNINNHLLDHSMRLSMSFCNWVLSAWESILLNILVSSAKRNILLLLCTTSGRSFIYSTNKMGPRTLPWGMPLVTGADLDILFLILMHWVLLERKDCIHPSILPVMPYFSVLRSSRLWGTLSKAFMKSQYNV